MFPKPFSLGDRERRQRSFHDRKRLTATIARHRHVVRHVEGPPHHNFTDTHCSPHHPHRPQLIRLRQHHHKEHDRCTHRRRSPSSAFPPSWSSPSTVRAKPPPSRSSRTPCPTPWQDATSSAAARPVPARHWPSPFRSSPAWPNRSPQDRVASRDAVSRGASSSLPRVSSPPRSPTSSTPWPRPWA
jgi:hypothetical protein